MSEQWELEATPYQAEVHEPIYEEDLGEDTWEEREDPEGVPQTQVAPQSSTSADSTLRNIYRR